MKTLLLEFLDISESLQVDIYATGLNFPMLHAHP